MIATTHQERLAVASARLVNVRQQLADLQSQVKPLTLKMGVLQGELAELESAVFIAANDIHKGDVEFSNGVDRPYFRTVSDFKSWLLPRRPNVKPWVEWNGRILRTSDLIEGSAVLCAPGRIEDLPD